MFILILMLLCIAKIWPLLTYYCYLLLAASVEACRRNIKFNGSVACSKVESNLADARVYMLTHPKEFDVVCRCYHYALVLTLLLKASSLQWLILLTQIHSVIVQNTFIFIYM